MTIVTIVLAIYATVSLVYWLRTAAGVIHLRRGVPKLSHCNCPQPRSWPRLSVVVPACNEADKLEAAARTLLNQDYDNLQVIFVDDRSTDETGRIVDRIAGDDRARAIHIAELPDGWLGKVHALERGLGESDGDYVLFTDADVHFQPGMLRKAMAYVLDGKLDHLAAAPALWPGTFWTDLMILTFLRQLFTLLIPPWRVSDPASKAFFGVGAFNLVRRAAFDATEGFAWLRMETGDDMGLALMMKRSGGRCAMVLASDLLGLQWHRTVGEAMRGCEKAYAAAMNCRLSRTLVVAGGFMLLELSPVLTLLPLAWGPTRAVGVLGIAVALLFALSAGALARWAGGSVVRALLTPLAAPLSTAVIIRAGILGRLRGGITWRGTLYPADQLRAGRRVRLW